MAIEDVSPARAVEGWFIAQGSGTRELLALAMAALTLELHVGVGLSSTEQGSIIEGITLKARGY